MLWKHFNCLEIKFQLKICGGWQINNLLIGSNHDDFYEQSQETFNALFFFFL